MHWIAGKCSQPAFNGSRHRCRRHRHLPPLLAPAAAGAPAAAATAPAAPTGFVLAAGRPTGAGAGEDGFASAGAGVQAGCRATRQHVGSFATLRAAAPTPSSAPGAPRTCRRPPAGAWGCVIPRCRSHRCGRVNACPSCRRRGAPRCCSRCNCAEGAAAVFDQPAVIWAATMLHRAALRRLLPAGHSSGPMQTNRRPAAPPTSPTCSASCPRRLGDAPGFHRTTTPPLQPSLHAAPAAGQRPWGRSQGPDECPGTTAAALDPVPAPGSPPPLGCPLPAAAVGLLPGLCLLLGCSACERAAAALLFLDCCSQQQDARLSAHTLAPHAPPDAPEQGLFKRAEAPPASGLAERPLYKPSEMVQMGPFKVSPMGFGTWAWCAVTISCNLSFAGGVARGRCRKPARALALASACRAGQGDANPACTAASEQRLPLLCLSSPCLALSSGALVCVLLAGATSCCGGTAKTWTPSCRRCSTCWWPGADVGCSAAAINRSQAACSWMPVRQQVLSMLVARRLLLWLLVYKSCQLVGMPVRFACTCPAAIGTA